MSGYQSYSSGKGQAATTSTVMGDEESIFKHAEPEDDIGDTAGMPMINKYYRGPRIGAGQHGEVYLCWRQLPQPPGEKALYVPVAIKAVKRINPRDQREQRYKQLRERSSQGLPPRSSGHLPVVDTLGITEQKVRKEVAIMKKLRHPHIVRLFEVIDDRMKDRIYMVMEFLAGGEIIWRFDNGRPVLATSQARRIIRDAVLGLEYLHGQGIIHRDIKPANLLWTADRTQVKIADFGVSHFSYAQRMSAAGEQAAKERVDEILMDERDLTRCLGTPSFVAPEAIWGYHETLSMSPIGQASTHQDSALSPELEERPPITKAIDIWALGVTLYCLLFGRTPFTVSNGNEHDLYRVILRNQWDVDPTMGSDCVPTGDHGANLATAIDLLERFLQKDYRRRISLDDVKSHPWVLEDLPDPVRWLQATAPTPKIKVTDNETEDAMSVVRFKWIPNWNPRSIANRVSNFFTRTRAPRPAPIPEAQQEETSLPSTSRQRTSRLSKTRSATSGAGPSTPGGRRAPARATVPYVASSPGLFAPRSEFISRKDKGKKKEEHRSHAWDASLGRRQRSGNLSDYSWPSSVAASPATEKSKWRFKIPKFQKSSTSTQASTSNRPQDRHVFVEDYDHLRRVVQSGARRSAEQLWRYQHARQHSDGGLLTAARRASSWGQGDEPLEFAEVMSITSSEWMLNEHDFVVGAGGVEKTIPLNTYAPRVYKPKPRPQTSYIANVSATEDNSSTPRRRSMGEDYRDDTSSIASGYGEGGEARWTNSLDDWDDDTQLHKLPSSLQDGYTWDDNYDDPQLPPRTAPPGEVIRRTPGDADFDLGFSDDNEEPEYEEDDDEDEEEGAGVVFAPRGRPLNDDELRGVPFGSGA